MIRKKTKEDCKALLQHINNEPILINMQSSNQPRLLIKILHIIKCIISYNIHILYTFPIFGTNSYWSDNQNHLYGREHFILQLRGLKLRQIKGL